MPLHGDEYISRKGYHSVNVQAPCNASVDVSGSVHDSRIWTNSKICNICINEVATCISVHLGPLWIKFPVDPLTRNLIKTGFMEIAGLPGVIGCMDCTHIAILAPSQEEHNYVNRKGYHSKNVQIVCSFNLEILYINARYPGFI
nr:unnamed protein product [Callosobruchus analis]